MAHEDRAPAAGARFHARKPTPVERRERRAAVEDPGEVLEAGARFLEVRPRSVTEVRRRLTRLGYRTELVAVAIERLAELGFLDDAAFAQAWVESRDRSRPRGEHALRRELGLKGLDRSLVDAVLDERREDALGTAAAGDPEPSSPDDAAAERLLEKKLPAILREPDGRRRRQRAYALLARNGFSPDICTTVTKRVLAGASIPLDDETLGDREGE
jgi:regulatory protein